MSSDKTERPEPGSPVASKVTTAEHDAAPQGRFRPGARLDRERLGQGGAFVAWMIASFLLFGTLWHLASTYVVNPRLMPPPALVIERAWGLLLDGSLWPDIIASMRRVFVGLALGSVTGVVLGLTIGRIRLVDRLVDPVVQLLRNLSPTAMIPIAIVWFGIGESSKYFLIFWGTVFFVSINTTAGVHGVPQTRIRAAQCLGATELAIFGTIMLPSALPYIFAGIRLAVASAFMTIVPAELLAAQSGIGALLQEASLMGQTDRMFVALLVIALMGFGSDRLVRIIADHPLGRYTRYLSKL